MISFVSYLLAVLMSRTGVSGLGARPTPLLPALDPSHQQPQRVKQAKVDKFWPLPYEFPTSCFFPSHRSLHYCPGSRHLTPLILLIQLVQSISFPFHFSRAKPVQVTSSLQRQSKSGRLHAQASSAPLSYHRTWIQGLPIYLACDHLSTSIT